MTGHLHGPPEAQEYRSPYPLTRTNVRLAPQAGRTSLQARADETAYEALASLPLRCRIAPQCPPVRGPAAVLPSTSACRSSYQCGWAGIEPRFISPWRAVSPPVGRRGTAAVRIL